MKVFIIGLLFLFTSCGFLDPTPAPTSKYPTGTLVCFGGEKFVVFYDDRYSQNNIFRIQKIDCRGEKWACIFEVREEQIQECK